MSHVSYERVMSHIYEPCLVCMSHVSCYSLLFFFRFELLTSISLRIAYFHLTSICIFVSLTSILLHFVILTWILTSLRITHFHLVSITHFYFCSRFVLLTSISLRITYFQPTSICIFVSPPSISLSSVILTWNLTSLSIAPFHLTSLWDTHSKSHVTS